MHVPASAQTFTLGGQFTTGVAESITSTIVSHVVVLPQASQAWNVMVFDPITKAVPGNGLT